MAAAPSGRPANLQTKVRTRRDGRTGNPESAAMVCRAQSDWPNFFGSIHAHMMATFLSEGHTLLEVGKGAPSYLYHMFWSLQCSKKTHPILGTRDIQRAIDFYTQQLGFKLAFGDKADPPNYVGFRRDAVELHMQFQFEHEMGTIRLRFLVEDPDALFNEYRQRAVDCTPNCVRDTPRANSPSMTWIVTRSPSTAT
jgi:hypothetical protein